MTSILDRFRNGACLLAVIVTARAWQPMDGTAHTSNVLNLAVGLARIHAGPLIASLQPGAY